MIRITTRKIAAFLRIEYSFEKWIAKFELAQIIYLLLSTVTDKNDQTNCKEEKSTFLHFLILLDYFVKKSLSNFSATYSSILSSVTHASQC